MGKMNSLNRLNGLVTSALLVGVAVVIASCSSSPTPQLVTEIREPEVSAVDVGSAEIVAIELAESDAGYQLDIRGDRPLVWTSYRDQSGRLIVELPNARTADAVNSLEYGEGLIESISIDTDTSAEEPLSRLVVATRSDTEHSLVSQGGDLRVQILPIGDFGDAQVHTPIETIAAAAPVGDVTPVEREEAAGLMQDDEVAEAEVADADLGGSQTDTSQDWGSADAPKVGPEPTGVTATSLQDVTVASDTDSTTVQVRGDGEFYYSTFRLDNPSRFVIDLFGVVSVVESPNLVVERSPIERVRVAQFRPRPDLVARVVVDLDEAQSPTILSTLNGIDVVFGESQMMAEALDVDQPSADVFDEMIADEATAVAAPIEPAAIVAELSDDPATDEYAVVDPPAETEFTDSDYENAFDETDEAAVEVADSAADDWEWTDDDAAVADAAPMDDAYEATAAKMIPIEQAPAPIPVGATEPETQVTYYEAAETSGDSYPQETSQTVASFESKAIGGTEKEYTGELMTLNLKNGDVKDVLRSFAEISGLNMVVDPDVDGSVTVELVDVPWDQALEQILKINGLDYVLEGSIMRIAPVDKLADEASKAQQLAQAQALAIPLRTIIQRISYAEASSIARLLRGSNAGILSQRGSVTVDQRTNTLIIKELPNFMDTVIAVIENLDIPEPQVAIEARIVETTKRFTRTLGVNWGITAEASAAKGNTTGLVFPNNADATGGVNLLTGGSNGLLDFRLGNVLNSFQLDVTLQAAENEGLINILSAPKVTTLNNTAAEIQSGLQIPVQTVANNTVSVQFVNATLRLNVTPHVTAEGTVLMDIDIQKREPQLAFAVVGAQNAPIATKEAKTRVIVRDGGTTVIGGIYEVSTDQGEDRVPGLANVPILKHLFKNRRRTDENEELLIFITPRVIKL